MRNKNLSMKKIQVNSSSLLVLFTIVMLLISSCVSQKKIKYLQKQQEEDTTSSYPNKRSADYKIQPKDNLYIRIYSFDEKSILFFNKQAGAGSYNDYATDAAIYLNSYTVSQEGTIDFPIVGKVLVRGLTVEQAKNAVQKTVDEYLKETMVVLKLVNFNITVVGEVYKPGQFKIYQDEINIFQAISLAGDLRDFANRSKIALIRKTREGSKVYYLNLNSDRILGSDQYFMMPDDIIYVPPLKSKQYGFETFPYVVVLTAITALSTLLLTIYTIKL